MGRNIDDIADDRFRGHDSPGEQFYEQFLAKRPQSQWPSYVDEIAVDISADIGIGTTDLDRYNFPDEVGPLYRKGMFAAAGDTTDIQTILDDTVDARDLGTIVFQLNQLRYEVEQSETGLDNVHHALEAVIEKVLTQETGLDIATSQHRESGSIADVVMDLFSDTEIAAEAGPLVDEFEDSLGQGLLARLDEPQMMTPLWTHQLSALDAWQTSNYRGYVDMATATGKTVLGLAAIALRYGSLHPLDELQAPTPDGSRDRILIVAHNDLILEQWRREFDRHLNIPEERTQGSDEITLTWGEIHFRTPQRLINQSQYPYDLVVLDEAHHYATAQQWGELLDEFDDDIIALSGSVDDAGTDSHALQERLQNKVGPELERYSITDAQQDGIIPAFDWEVRYAPYEADDEFINLSQTVESNYNAFQDRIEAGELDTDRPLQTFDQLRTFSHTTAGTELKRSDDEFRDLITSLFSRRTKRWHLSPTEDAIAEIVTDHQNDHVLVLADNNKQVQSLTDRLNDELGGATTVRAATSEQSRAALRDLLDEFDAAEAGGVVVGTGDLLGEGVDIPRANVAVNMATGGVNTQLVQRIGRILRNPTGDKHAHFYNVVGLPDTDAAIPSEDGRRIIEHAAEFCALGARFDNLPGFATATDLDDQNLTTLLRTGTDTIHELQDTGAYDQPDDPAVVDHLEGLIETLTTAPDSNANTVLAEWSQYSWYESSHSTPSDTADVDEPIDEPDPANRGKLIVNVLDPVGKSLADATITVHVPDDQEIDITETDPGTWSITAPMGTQLRVEASHPDFQSTSTPLSIDSSLYTHEFTVQQPETPPGIAPISNGDSAPSHCTIHVVDQSDDPIDEAAVSISTPDSARFGRTQADGTLTISRTEFEGEVRIAARHPDAGLTTGELQLPTHEDLRISLSTDD